MTGPAERDWRALLGRFAPYDWLYENSRFARSDLILKRHLGIPEALPLPITFQHGVDFGAYPLPIDIQRPEPLFVAHTEEAASTAQGVKPVVRLPHPWLLLPPAPETGTGEGTLFVGIPSGAGSNDRLAEAIASSDLPRPWSILLKSRSSHPLDHDWWSQRGFEAFSAGPHGEVTFLPNQRAILASHARIAVPYMSSIAVFAAALGKPVSLVRGVTVEWIEDERWLPQRSDVVGESWRKLLNAERGVATAEAMRLLGGTFHAKPAALAKRLFDAIAAISGPVHFDAVKSRVASAALTALVRRRIPVGKFMPTPVHALGRKLVYLAGLNWVHLVSGNAFEHFGLTEGRGLTVSRVRSYRVGRKIQIGQAPVKSVIIRR